MTAEAGGGAPGLPAGVRVVAEEPAGLDIPVWAQPEWAERFPWLVQGTTGAGTRDGDDPFDLGLFGPTPVGHAVARWARLRSALGVPRAVHSRQVHRAEVQRHDDGPPGLLVTDGFDGHVTRHPGVLLTVSVADCVPVSLVDPEGRGIALVHGGWRGTAAGVVGRGLAALGAAADRVWVHLGPAICGRCYEVGPEVHQALGLPRPVAPTPVDVRAVQARQAVAAGVRPERVTMSGHCTRCGDGFFSHRGGSPGRQMGLLAVRP